ncbi:MAG TPA: response regulator [Herpetosiphonaceae bacterium]
MIDPHAPPLRVVLVVDSEPTIAAVAIPLTEAGHAVAMVQTAREVFKLIEAQPWDAVVIDLSPIESALDLARRIHQRHSNLSIILLSEPPPPQVIDTGLSLGVYDWLFKPGALSLVMAALHRARERRMFQQSAAQPGEASDRGGARHEINNQLAGIIGLVQLHLVDETLPAELRQDLTLVLKHAQQLRDLLRAKRSK